MDKEVKIAAISFAALLIIIALWQPIIFANNNKNFGFSELSVLGQTQTLSGYPRQLVVGQPFLLYGHIENHERQAEYYQFTVKLGNESTLVSNATAANAIIIFRNSVVLLNNQTSTFPMLLSLTNIGNNQRLIFELWTFNSQESAFQYTGIWNEIWVNVTTP